MWRKNRYIGIIADQFIRKTYVEPKTGLFMDFFGIQYVDTCQGSVFLSLVFLHGEIQYCESKFASDKTIIVSYINPEKYLLFFFQTTKAPCTLMPYI